MFIIAAKNWKQYECPPVRKWLSKLRCITPRNIMKTLSRMNWSCARWLGGRDFHDYCVRKARYRKECIGPHFCKTLVSKTIHNCRYMVYVCMILWVLRKQESMHTRWQTWMWCWWRRKGSGVKQWRQREEMFNYSKSLVW